MSEATWTYARIDLPAHLPRELAFQRFLTAPDVPHQPKADGRYVCRWCLTPIPPPSRKRAWCSKKCLHSYMDRAFVPAHRIWERDHGVCAVCGIDTDFLQTWRRKIECTRYTAHLRNIDVEWGPWATCNYKLWEADHIVPVIEGGGCCGLDNYRTLCIPCHKADTAALAARRARAKRPQLEFARAGCYQ